MLQLHRAVLLDIKNVAASANTDRRGSLQVALDEVALLLRENRRAGRQIMLRRQQTQLDKVKGLLETSIDEMVLLRNALQLAGDRRDVQAHYISC